MTTKRRYVIDWRIDGTFEVDAASAAEAQAIFDQKFNTPSGIMPMRDGEVTSSEPELVKP